MSKTYEVVHPFTLRLDDGEAVHFGPGETVPEQHAGHWYVQAQVVAGYVRETEAPEAAPEAEAEAPPARKRG